jgi:hypothetical protein
LKPWFQDASFEYHKPYFDLKGGSQIFQSKNLK